jgi:phage shock protein C
MNLYRNTDDKMIAGVCAGLADHFDVAHWVVRLVFVCGFLFTGTVAMLAYVVAWILLAPRCMGERADTLEYDERRREYRPRNVFRYGEDVTTRLRAARQRLDKSTRRIEDMESYVTSRHYQLNKEFADLAD